MSINRKNLKKIAVIGAGWFGCHIATELIKEGFDVTIYEKEKNIFLNGSGNNTNRLHLGYHYPRSFATRKISLDGFKKFTKYYPKFSRPIESNIYAIANSKLNKTSVDKFEEVLKESKLKYSLIPQKKIKLNHIKKAYLTHERIVLFYKARTYFQSFLKKNIIFNKKIKSVKKINKKYKISNKLYDYVVNCSWQQSFKQKKLNLIYEHCYFPLFKKKNKKHNSYTIIDGPFYTLFEWNKILFSLYSVKDSRILSSKNFNLEKKSYKQFKKEQKKKALYKIVNGFLEFYPSFKKNFKYIKDSHCIRTITKNTKDARVCSIKNDNNFIHVMSGKIDHIFYAYEKVRKCIKIY